MQILTTLVQLVSMTEEGDIRSKQLQTPLTLPSGLFDNRQHKLLNQNLNALKALSTNELKALSVHWMMLGVAHTSLP